jgi:hypothetical protein
LNSLFFMVLETISPVYSDWITSESLRVTDFSFSSPDAEALATLITSRLDLANVFLADIAFVLEVAVIFSVVFFLVSWLFRLVSDIALGWNR